MASVVKVSNVDHSLEAWCRMCGNTGWCELGGTVVQLGVTYSRGVAPCRWCQLGVKRFERARTGPRPWSPASRFAESDVVPFGEREPAAEPAPGPVVRVLPGLEGAPVRDFEAAARSCYSAWRRYLGKDMADVKVRANYPAQAEAVILEADALDVPAEPVDDVVAHEPSRRDELDAAAIERDRAGELDEDAEL